MKRKTLITLIIILAMLICHIPQHVMAEERVMEFENGIVLYENTRYSFRNASSGWYMNIRHAGKSNGTHVNLWPLDMSEPNTQCYTFSFVSIEDKTVMISPICAPSRYIDVRRWNKPFALAQKICIWEADGDPIKELIIEMQEDGSCFLTFKENKKYCIGAESPTAAKTEQTQLVVCEKTGAAEQRWYICDETGEVLQPEPDTVYDSVLNLFDTVLEGLSNTKELYSTSSYWVYKPFHEVHLNELIIDMEGMRRSFVNLYEHVLEHPEDEKNWNDYETTIKVLRTDIEKDIQALKEFKDSTQMKLIGGQTIKKYIDEVISWFDWLDNLESMITEVEKFAQEEGKIDYIAEIVAIAKNEYALYGDRSLAEPLKYNYNYSLKTRCGNTAWCADFVNWCAAQAGVPMSIIPHEIDGSTKSKTSDGYSDYGRTYQGYPLGSVRNLVSYMKTYCNAKEVRLTSKEILDGTFIPQAGDLIIYCEASYSSDKTDYGHVGLVIGFDEINKKVITIEGNTKSGEKYRCIAQKSRTYNKAYVDTNFYIQGYIRPDYEQ